jgi:hypothetical protein
MTLNEFVIKMQANLNIFRVTWLSHAEHAKTVWPLEMDEADWHEQFTFFMDKQHKIMEK